jgi:hypothetical protein
MGRHVNVAKPLSKECVGALIHLDISFVYSSISPHFNKLFYKHVRVTYSHVHLTSIYKMLLYCIIIQLVRLVGG